ncbi:MAG: anthranilate phosphoribosyltransferase [Candidatus Hydrogenedentes bacterium]|nr:anthranilate phosphoribosyltransferase [Candidatus Hydrogenedentota bacterium]
MLHDALNKFLNGEHLSRKEAASVMDLIMSGEVTAAQMAAFLVAIRFKGETVEEIAGFAETMRAKATKVTTARRPLVDTCGTGGDRAGTFNISTTAAFVVAGAGVAVAKHGNRSASSLCGSADVLETLGVNVNATPEQVGHCIDEIGIGFLFARTLHTAMKHVGPVRQELKIRTVFNFLGPLTNPANADGQVIGVPDPKLGDKLAEVLTLLGTRRAFVVSGSDGLDEITLTGPTHIAESHHGTVTKYEITPETAGLQRASGEELLGGDAQVNAVILRDVLSGKIGPHRDIVLLNAAAGILASHDGEADWRGAVKKASESIDSGAALAKLDALVDYSHRIVQ